MNAPSLYQRNFLLHLQERPGYDRPVLLKEIARERPSRSQLDQLHNEYAVTRKLAGVAGVRPAFAKEGTESRPVLILEYIQGHSLAELIRSASLDLAEKLRLALNLTRALGHIHERKVTHKDVSSGNILIADTNSPGSQDGVYLIDFGLASTTGEDRPSRLAPDDSLVGSLAYVSPEQTGRMNRRVDFRTDLYSLGVCLYELFTSQLPFDGGDALEMIHAHIARRPEPPRQIDTDVPGPVSDIILKLLAKSAEDRYQTAAGLAADLQRCLDQWRSEGRIGALELGADDFTGRLQIPQKLYGREGEIARLKTTLDRAIAGPAQLLLVAGYSGVGKTSLVHEIQKEVIGRQATFVEGKFDQLQRTLPYSGWEQALTQLVSYWLAGSEDALAQLGESILEAVGDQAQILVDFIPALERVIGPQPDVPQLGGIENQNRFNYIFGRFIKSLATPEHPLVVFLDDLQWIDLASLNLIQALFAAQSNSSLLVIGAYRSNEVDLDHPLVAIQEQLRAESERVNIISLEDLQPADTNQMLADTLRLPARECLDLDRLLLDKTAGNPFYFRQLLLALESEALLRFDRSRRRWVWEEELPQRLQAGGNVVDLMIGRIRTLPEHTQRILAIAACIGSRFDASALACVMKQPREEILTHLDPALRAGLVIQSNGHCRFSHDRIQEAGYALIPESERPGTHLEIGRQLLANTAAEDLGEEIFDIVGHLDLGRILIEAEPEQLDLVELNLKAGQKAKGASAFAEAIEYVDIGLGLLGADSWQEQYELTLSLLNEKAELVVFMGRYDQIPSISAVIEAHAKCALDQVPVYMTRIEAATTQMDFSAAVDIGLEILGRLGVEIPSNPSDEDYARLKDNYLELLTDEPAEMIAGLTEMTDERALAVSGILASLLTPTYVVRPEIFPFVGLVGASLSLENGYNVWSPVFFAVNGNIFWTLDDLGTPTDQSLGRLSFIRRMHQAALQMLEARRYRRSRTRTIGQICVSGAFCFPVGFLSELARTMYLSSFETGDLNYGGQGAMHMTIYGLLGGRDLDQVRREAIESYESLRQQNQVVMAVWLSMFLEGAIAFQEGLGELGHLTGRYFDEHAYLPSAQAANDFTGMHFLASMKLVLTYHFDLDGELLACLHAANRATVGAAGMLTLGVTKWYSTLAWLRLFPGLTPEDRTRALSEVDRSLEHLGIWSQSAPKNFGHVVHLVMAEKARVTGTTDEALSHYERAIEDARESGFIQDEALANELYARFWAERGSERFAAPLMREAYSLYSKWGAHAKAEHLAKRYPNWLIGRRIVVDEPATGSISAEMPGGLDLGTVLKTSQDIASELLLDGLLAKLMAHVIESSGAQKGYLILQEEGHWTIVSEASADDPQRSARTAKHIDESDALATGIVRYVARTQQAVALEDASGSGDFVNDPYVQAHRARSILCTPLVNRGKITAILYLENNLAPGAFSPERVGLLRLLSSQMAISIENARIHADLEALLDSRSKALASAEEQVRTLFESSPVGIALSNLDGWLLSVNKAVLDMVRIKEDELLEHNVVDFYDDPGDRDALLRELNESGMVQDFGVRLVRRDGSRFYASMNVSKLVIEGNEVLLAMVQDVTAQINAEQESAALGERARLARELHDAVSQTILSASLLADTAVRASKAGRPVLTQDLDNLRRMLRGALDELRTMLLELRPVALQDRTLGQMLGTLAETARGRSSAAVDLEIKGDRVLPERVTTTLYRIAQESLNNAVRHAAAQRIRIDLACDPDEVVLVICDDGLGFDIESSSAGHHGLDIMRERAEEIGAVLEIESRAGSGTRVTANWS